MCLRRIYKIPPFFVSRVSNESVLAIRGQKRFSDLLSARQVHLYTKISDMHDNSLIRSPVCESDSNCPRQWFQKRKRGRPKLQWSPCVFKMTAPLVMHVN